MHSTISSYSIWGEESPPRTPLESYQEQPPEQQQQQQQQQVVQHHIPEPKDVSEYSIWGEQQLQQQLQQQMQQQQQQQQRPGSPSIVVRVKDGQQVLSEVVSSSSSSNGAGLAPTADKAVQTSEPSLMAQQQQQQKQQKVEAKDKPWWSPVVFWLPGQKGADAADAAAEAGQQQQQQSKAESAATAVQVDGRSDSPEETEPNSALLHAQEPLSSAQRAWWQPLIDNDFIKSLPGMPNAAKDGSRDAQQQQQDAAQAAAADEQQQHGPQQEHKQKQWWEDLAGWLPKPSSSSDAAGAAADGSADGSKPVEAIVIPADLPLEEIAKEVAKLKEDAWRSKEDHLESLWAKTVERNDRSWLMLLCFLLSVVIGLLSVVAWRISGLEGAPDEAATAAAAAGAGQMPLALLGLAAAALVHWGM
jgi:hypothetical protein